MRQLLVLFLLIVSYQSYSNVTDLSLLPDSTKRALRKERNDSLKQAGYISYKNDFGIEYSTGSAGPGVRISAVEKQDTSLYSGLFGSGLFGSTKEYSSVAYSNRFSLYYAGFKYHQNINVDVNEDGVTRKSSSFNIGIPYRGFYFSNGFTSSKYDDSARFESLKFNEFNSRVVYRPFKSRYVNLISSSAYSQTRSSIALEAILTLNYSSYSNWKSGDVIFSPTNVYYGVMFEKLHGTVKIAQFGIAPSIRVSSNLVIFQSVFLAFSLEYGIGIGKGRILKQDNTTILKPTLRPQPLTYAGGIGWSRRRFYIKLTGYGYGVGYSYPVSTSQYVRQYNFRSTYVARYISIGYRFAEPKKLGLFREKMTKRSKDKIKEIISPVD